MKQHPVARYLMRLSVFSIAVCFMFLFYMLFSKGALSPRIPYYIIMFWCLTGAGYCLVYFLPKRSAVNFVNAFLLAKFGKMIIYLVVLLAVYLLDIEKDKMFAVVYCIIFVLYLIFDTLTLKALAKNKKIKYKDI